MQTRTSNSLGSNTFLHSDTHAMYSPNKAMSVIFTQYPSHMRKDILSTKHGCDIMPYLENAKEEAT